MSPELLNNVVDINIEKSNIFSIGILILKIILFILMKIII